MLCGSRRRHIGCLCPDHRPGWTGDHEGQRPDERKGQENEKDAQGEEGHDEIRRRHGEGWNEERYQVNSGIQMKAKAALPPGSAAFVHLRWPAALERTGGHRSSVRPLATTQRNQKGCETGLTLGPPQAAVAGSRMPEKPCGRNTIIIRDDVIE